ncbi:hypothetical protein BLA6993_07649 [Burkholderia lata]|uniref:hypothetical protein n=1 Tax=Burkholderia lata (strain ATCC 17760 / DSM 23089 / LMG 22485 / NCIMB 9086 / R18194 / 383) TaxID=482957 RepID=UPI00145315C6|nr:hypothetical protein [Burkholderia lata]VWC48325.1 hypothetical protein BLA6993_07649 [Burkholderia lata]
MSDNFTYLVDPLVSLAEAPAAAQRMIAWLQAHEIVGAATRVGDLYRDWCRTYGLNGTGLTERNETGYPPGPRYTRACDARAALPPPVPNWLTVIVERRIFDAGGNGLEVFCPSCEAEQTAFGPAWSDAFTRWFHGDDDAPLVCAACGHRQPVTRWRYDPPWAFGHLGFCFKNWLLSDAFIAEFGAAYGRPLSVVHQHI